MHPVNADNLQKAFVDADSTLYDQLDKLITLFKASAPDFYALYKTARNVVSVGKAGHREKTEKAEN